MQLLGESQESIQNKYKNNIQFPKKHYPLKQAKADHKVRAVATASKSERAPWIANID